MNWRSAIADMEYRCRLADEFAPRDVFTRVAVFLVKGPLLVLTPILLISEFVTTLIGGCLLAITFGLFEIVLTIIWLPMYAFLIGTSWLWLRAWYLRPLLLVPGAIMAIVAATFVALAPEPERDAKHAKLSFAQEWPVSWYLLRPPPAYGMVQCDVCNGEGRYPGTGDECFACAGTGRITPELSRRLNEELSAGFSAAESNRLTGREHYLRMQEIIDEMQYGKRPGDG